MTTWKRRLKRAALVAAVVLAVALAGFVVWAQVYYHAGEVSRSMAAAGVAEPGGVAVQDEDSCIAVGDESAAYGLILYPGAKVDPVAYVPLAAKLADRGVFCVIAKMPFNLAILDADAADELIDAYSNVAHWWVGGHSLGGVRAAAWAESHADRVEGVALLASYGSERLTEMGLSIVDVCGSNDDVVNRDSLGRFTELLPAGSVCEIRGGNHAGFGDYGPQSGDGAATITADEQQELAARAVAEAMLKEGA